MLTVPNGQSIQVAPLSPNSSSYYVIPATTTLRRGRLYLYHGLSGAGVNQMNPSLLLPNPFYAAFAADGWEIIFGPDPADYLPYIPVGPNSKWSNALVNPEMRDDPTLGAKYIETMKKTFLNLDARVCADRGYLPPMVGGSSWGGITSCHLVMSLPLVNGKPWAGFFAANTPTMLGPAIVDLFGFITFPFSTAGFDLATSSDGTPTGTWTSNFLNALTVPGHVSVGCEDGTVYPFGPSVMVQNALAANGPLASRVIFDGIISGGTTLTSNLFCWCGNNENGAKAVAPGVIPASTTISGISGPAPAVPPFGAPWTMTLSNPSTNTPTFAITNLVQNGTTWVFTTSTPHGMSPGQFLTTTGFPAATGGAFIGTYWWNLSNVLIAATTANTITVANTLTSTGTGPVPSYASAIAAVGVQVSFPGLIPSYKAAHLFTPEMQDDILAWVSATIDPNYLMAY